MVLGLHPWVAAWPRAPEALADGWSPLGLGVCDAGSGLGAGGDGCKHLLALEGLEASGLLASTHGKWVLGGPPGCSLSSLAPDSSRCEAALGCGSFPRSSCHSQLPASPSRHPGLVSVGFGFEMGA